MYLRLLALKLSSRQPSDIFRCKPEHLARAELARAQVRQHREVRALQLRSRKLGVSQASQLALCEVPVPLLHGAKVLVQARVKVVILLVVIVSA